MKGVRCAVFALLLAAWLVPASSAMAATPYPVQVRPGFMTGNSDVGTDMNLDILAPLWGTERRLLFFNPNFRIDDNDGNEQNIGFGFRGMTDGGLCILGGNLFFDTMRSEFNERYTQWGIGAELLSHWIDLRANYYNPFGDTENVIDGGGVTSGFFFSGHSLLSGGGLQLEEALKGFDLEASVLVPGISNIMETRLAATYYQFDADLGTDIDGWRSRLEIRPVKAINLSLEYRDDDVRGGNTFVGGYLEVPLSLDNLLAGKNPFLGAGDMFSFGKGVRPLKERMTDKVVRDRHIVAKATTTQGGGAGQAVVDNQMIFVNQDNTNAGDGSYENPYQSLELAMADEARFHDGAWVYVFSSDSIADTYANTSFTLRDNMVFWGQGYTHPVYGLGGGDNPILDGNWNPSVVTLANNNEVMGFTIQHGGEGIYGRNVRGTNIHHNIVRENSMPSSGIHIENVWTPDDIDGQTLTYRFANNQILDNSGDGIYLRTDIQGSGKLENTSIDNLFTDNVVQGNSGHGLYSRIYRYSNAAGSFIVDSSFSSTFTGNTVGGSEEGQGNGYDGISSDIEMYSFGATSPVSNTSLTSRFTANTVVNNGGDGIRDDYLTVYSSGSDSGLSNVRINRYITDNEIHGNSYDGYSYSDTTLRTYGPTSPITDSSINSQINNNMISGNGQNAIVSWNSSLSTYGSDSPISGSTITNAYSQNQLDVATPGYDGIHSYNTFIRTEGTGSGLTDVSIDHTITGNLIDGAATADDGIQLGNDTSNLYLYILASNANSPITNARFSNTFTGNTVTNFLGDGLYFPGVYIRTGPFGGYSGNSTNSPISGSTINNTLTNNTVTDNGGYGIFNWRNEIKTQAGVTASSTNNTYSGNTVDRNGQTGIFIDEDFGGGANTGMNYTFTNNNIRDNGSAGLYMYIDPSNADLIAKTLFMQGNTITGNVGNGLEIYINGTNPAMFKGDLGGGLLSSTGGNTFSGDGTYDIYHEGNATMDIWALNNHWTNDANPESTIWDKQDASGNGDIITSLRP